MNKPKDFPKPIFDINAFCDAKVREQCFYHDTRVKACREVFDLTGKPVTDVFEQTAAEEIKSEFAKIRAPIRYWDSDKRMRNAGCKNVQPVCH